MLNMAMLLSGSIRARNHCANLLSSLMFNGDGDKNGGG